jgi:hypothetical protein
MTQNVTTDAPPPAVLEQTDAACAVMPHWHVKHSKGYQTSILGGDNSVGCGELRIPAPILRELTCDIHAL